MIDIYVLDDKFQVFAVIDTYESFIWTDRFNSYGDFELYTSYSSGILSKCIQNYYLYIKESEHVMIIEGIEIEADAETGNKIRVTGRSLESILDRRIVWTQTLISEGKKFQDAIKLLIEDSIIDPQPYRVSGNTKVRTAQQKEISDARIIPNFIFQEVTDEYIDSLKVEKIQYTGDNLYDLFQTMIEDSNNTVGYKITLQMRYYRTIDTTMQTGKTYYEYVDNQYVVTADTSFQNNKTYYEYNYAFVFELYSGTDYSYGQKEYVKTKDTTMQPGKTYYKLVEGQYVVATEQTFQTGVTYYEKHELNPYVVFSPQFDNVINSNYLDDVGPMKNVTLVAGTGEGLSRKTIIVGSGTGLERRELFTDARDLSEDDYKGTNYTEALKTRGVNKLVENSRTTSYEGKVEATRQFVYGKNADFYMGDIIQMANEYGIEGNARVIEWVMSESSDGIETYPTFDAVQLIDDTTVEEEPDQPTGN